MPDPLVVQVMRTFRKDLLQREAAQRVQMAQRWQSVERALQDEVNTFVERVAADGLTPGQLRSRQFQLDRYASLLAQARREMSRYMDVLAPQIAEQQRTLGAQGIRAATAAINAITGTRVGFDVLPIAAIENLVGLAGNGSPLRSLLDASYGAGADGMLQQLINGVALGLNPRVIARNMVRNGLSQSLARVMVVARTEPLRVYRESSRQQYQASGVVTHFRRLATRDRRTCPACLFADGEVYDLPDSLRAHPQCRCTTLPVVDGFKPVEWEKGPDWFKKQPPAIQRKMLGNGVFDAWKRGDIELEQTVSVRQDPTWGDSLRPTPLRDILNAKKFFVRGLPEPKKPKAPKAPTINRQTATQARKQIAKLEKTNAKEIADINKQVAAVDKEAAALNKQGDKIFQELEKLDRKISPYNAKQLAGTLTDDELLTLRGLKQDRQRLTDEYDALDAQVRQILSEKIPLGRRVQLLNKQLQDDILKVVQVDDPSKIDLRFAPGTSPSVVAHVEAAKNEFNRLVSDTNVFWDTYTIDVKKLPPKLIRAFARPERGEIHILDNEEQRVIIHEMAHVLEVRGGLLDKALEFYDRRTKGESLEKLSYLTGDPRYDPIEVARRDKFMDPYIGRDYGRYATEVVSMGLEYMYAEPARLAKEDPDYFDFIYELVRGR